MTHDLSKHHWLVGVVLVYVGLAVWMQVHTPLLETPDAYYHYAVIDHLASTGELPPLDSAPYYAWKWMKYHAPLYYGIAAALTQFIPTDNFPIHFPYNPHAAIGNPTSEGNHNFLAHYADTWRGSGLAIRLAGWVNILLGAATLVCIYTLCGLLFPQQPIVALIAVAVVAFNPQFVFIHSGVSNDPLVTTLSTVGLTLTIWQIRTQTLVTTQRVVVLALVLALNAVAKASGMVLYPVVTLGMLWAVWRQRVPIWRVALYAVIGLVLWGVLAGWWYWRNWTLLGDPFATTQIATQTGLRIGGIAATDLRSELGGMYYSFWGVFGWFNVLPPTEFYTWTLVLLLASAIGWGWKVWKLVYVTLRQRQPFTISADNVVIYGLMLIFVVLFTLSWWQFHLMVNAAQGRLMFPLLGVFAWVVAVGLAQLPRIIPILLIAGLAICAALFPPLVIAPAYAADHDAPPLPEAAVAIHLREPHGQDACLTLWTLPARWQGTQDGSRVVELEVWWQAICPMRDAWSVFLHGVNQTLEGCVPGDTGYIFAQFDSMPQRGNLPFPAMHLGKIYYERYHFTLPSWIDVTQLTGVYLGLYDAVYQTGTRVPVRSEAFTDEIKTGKCAEDVVYYALPLLP